MPRNWIAVASAQHARRGRDESFPGFMQVGHGKLGPLKKVQPGDRVAYYAPTSAYGSPDGLQSFVSIGIAQPGEPYVFDMGGFVPYRRDVVSTCRPGRPPYCRCSTTSSLSRTGAAGVTRFASACLPSPTMTWR